MTQSPPIVQRVDALTLALLAVIAGLFIALLASRRRSRWSVDRDSAVAEETRHPADPQIAAAARLAPVGMVIADADGNRTFESDAARQYTAATADQAVVGLRLRNLVAEAGRSSEPVEQQIELYTPEQRTIHLQALPLFDGDDRIGTAAFVQDLTASSQIDSMRSDFIANASHELKTPLGAMRLLAEALAATEDPEVTKDLAGKIEAEAVRINRLVEDILDLAIIESAPPESSSVDLADVVADALAQTRTFSEALEIPIEHSTESLVVLGERRRLVSAVANLVENALTYTAAKADPDPDPIEVRLHAERALGVIEVEDHGIGIPARHLNRVFERFYRVDRGRGRASGGTGLGLAIARHVVENHGGTISVRSVPGEGSTFRIELPAVEA